MRCRIRELGLRSSSPNIISSGSGELDLQWMSIWDQELNSIRGLQWTWIMVQMVFLRTVCTWCHPVSQQMLWVFRLSPVVHPSLFSGHPPQTVSTNRAPPFQLTGCRTMWWHHKTQYHYLESYESLNVVRNSCSIQYCIICIFCKKALALFLPSFICLLMIPVNPAIFLLIQLFYKLFTMNYTDVYSSTE